MPKRKKSEILFNDPRIYICIYIYICMITMPPLLLAGEMMTFGFWVRLDNACVYFLGSDDSFGCEIAVKMIPWMKPLQKSVWQFR